MSNGNEGHSRRQVLTTVGSLSIAGAMGQAIASSSLASPAAAAQPNSEIAEKTFEATADNVVNTLEAAYGVNRGKRRNHTKGFGALGIFVGAPEAAEYSRSQLFSGQGIEVVARFSLAGGDPEASDTEKSARGLGLQFRLPGGSLHHITMLHTPMFFAIMPKTFLDKFLALKPDPATGKPDPEKFRAFLNSHPDNTSQFHFLQTTNPPPSYGNRAFYGIHTFKFVNKDNKVTMVRWRFVPQDGEKQLSDAEQKTMQPQPRFGLRRVRWRDVAGVQTPFGSRLDFAKDRNIGALRLDQRLIGKHVHVDRHGVQQHTLSDITKSFPPGPDLKFRDANAVRSLEAVEQDLGDRHADRPWAQCCALHRVVGQEIANRLQSCA